MRILYLSDGYTPHDHRFLGAISSAAEVTYFGRLEQGPVLESRLLPEGVKEIRWTPSGSQPDEVAQVLGQTIQRLRPDLVHAGPIPSVAFAAAKTGYRPLVSMSWGSDILVDAQSDPARTAARFALSHSNLAFADCRAVEAQLVALGMPVENIVVFPWGVDLAHFSAWPESKVRSELGWQEKRVVLSTRSLEPQYGAGIVMDGFIQSAEHDPDLRLLQLGQGSLYEPLQEKLAAADMAARVHFTGQLSYDQLPDYYRAADIYLTASKADGSSISLLEAMASGLPVLVSDIPGNREWVTESRTGWFFPVGNSYRLAEGITEAFSPPHQLIAMGRRAREVAEDRADWRKSVEIMLAGYQRVLEEAE